MWSLGQQGSAEAGGLSTDQVLAPFLGVFFVAFLVSMAATPLMRWLAWRYQVVDMPDLRRKVHRQPVPYLGGVAIFLGWLGGMILSLFVGLRLPVAGEVVGVATFPLTVIFGAAVITLVGLVDDVYRINPRVKVGGQLLAAAALAHEKVGIYLVEWFFHGLGWVDPPFWLCYVLGAGLIALFVLGGCNAMNLIDGMDGLAAGLTAIAMGGFLFVSVYVALQMGSPSPELSAGGDPLVTPTRIVLCLSTLGAVLGFLPYNFNPATIFMGDAGSLLLGFLCVATILMFGHTAQRGPVFAMAGLIIFALPIADSMMAIFRRWKRGQPISAADDQHTHHQLKRLFEGLGLSTGAAVKATVLSMYAMAAIFAVLGSAMVFLRLRYVLAAFLVIFGFIAIVAYKAAQRGCREENWKARQAATDSERTGSGGGDQQFTGLP